MFDIDIRQRFWGSYSLSVGTIIILAVQMKIWTKHVRIYLQNCKMLFGSLQNWTLCMNLIEVFLFKSWNDTKWCFIHILFPHIWLVPIQTQLFWAAWLWIATTKISAQCQIWWSTVSLKDQVIQFLWLNCDHQRSKSDYMSHILCKEDAKIRTNWRILTVSFSVTWSKYSPLLGSSWRFLRLNNWALELSKDTKHCDVFKTFDPDKKGPDLWIHYSLLVVIWSSFPPSKSYKRN